MLDGKNLKELLNYISKALIKRPLKCSDAEFLSLIARPSREYNITISTASDQNTVASLIYTCLHQLAAAELETNNEKGDSK